MKSILFLLTAAVSVLSAQTEIFGLRTFANNDEYRPPIITKDEYITIEFDVTTDLPPNLNVIFRHTSKDWVVDRNTFVNYEPKLRSEALLYSTAPNGVYHYTYRYRNFFPNRKSFVEFPYSGNYIYTIVDRDARDQVLAEGRFIIAETGVPVSMKVENKYHPEYSSPLNQMNYVTLNISAPNEYTATDERAIMHSDIRTVDIIKNWDLTHPMRIEVDKRTPDTFVEFYTMPNKVFSKRDVSPGNEYRRLDISSTQMYPNNRLVILRDQPDVSRYLWPGKPDANGSSKLSIFTDANSDYLEIEMRLRLAQKPSRRIFVVGGFTDWVVLPEYEMVQDSATGLFQSRFWARRGVYDYQYVLGDVDAKGNVIDQDWTALEGNDWRTINRLTALVYYYDRRFGGFDRVVGFVRGRNPGTTENGKSISISNPAQVAVPMLNGRPINITR
ncbi:MAG: type IX secretion system plug protein domain-containing protein [Bacteroidota bacterium]